MALEVVHRELLGSYSVISIKRIKGSVRSLCLPEIEEAMATGWIPRCLPEGVASPQATKKEGRFLIKIEVEEKFACVIPPWIAL